MNGYHNWDFNLDASIGILGHLGAEVPPVTDATFETVSIVDYSSQLFDACDWPWGRVFFGVFVGVCGSIS